MAAEAIKLSRMRQHILTEIHGATHDKPAKAMVTRFFQKDVRSEGMRTLIGLAKATNSNPSPNIKPCAHSPLIRMCGESAHLCRTI
jgi:hypothetical protein